MYLPQEFEYVVHFPIPSWISHVVIEVVLDVFLRTKPSSHPKMHLLPFIPAEVVQNIHPFAGEESSGHIVTMGCNKQQCK